MEQGEFKFLIEQAFQISNKELAVCGTVENGFINKGDIVDIPNKGQHKIIGIEMYRKKLEYIEAGDCAALFFSDLKKEDIIFGEYITSLTCSDDICIKEIASEPKSTIEIALDEKNPTESVGENNLMSVQPEKQTIISKKSSVHLEDKVVVSSDRYTEQSEEQTLVTEDSSQQQGATKKLFCYNCGEVINEKFNHCPYCGVDISILKNNTAKEDTDDELTNDEDEVEIDIAGGKIYYTKSFIDYNFVRRRFFDKASELEKEYIKFYTSRPHNFNGLFEEEIPEVVFKILEAVKFGVSVLMEYGIDDVDEEELSRMVSSDGSIKEALGYIFQRANQIDQYARTLGDYRDNVKDGRSHWEGGGFGLGGAIKGAITAGALNLGTNMFRGIGDAIANASDKSKISKMKQQLADDNKVFECLHNTVYEYSANVFFCVEEILVENEVFPEFEFDFQKIEARANNYMRKYNEIHNDETRIKTIDVLCDCINTCPYSPLLFYYLFSLYNGDKNEIHQLARYFGVERDYIIMIVEDDTELFNKIKSLDESTLGALNKKINKLENLHQENPYLNIAAYIFRLKQKRDKIVDENNNKISDEKECEKIKAKCEHFYNLIKENKLNMVWKDIENGDISAMYATKVYYYNLSKPDQGDIYEVNECISPITQKAKAGDTFAKYLVAFYSYTALNNTKVLDQGAMHKEEKSKLYQELKEIAGGGNIMAISDVGYLLCTHFWGEEEKGTAMLKQAAKELEPFALMHLGEGFREGRWKMVKNQSLSNRCFRYSSAYGIESNTQEKTSSGTSSSGCFITSAVCESFGKPDNCYELTTFRKFRDNWLAKQSDGKLLISEYYEVAPKILKEIDKNDDCKVIYKKIWDNYLYKCLKYIEENEFSMCKDLYCRMVNDLKTSFLINC